MATRLFRVDLSEGASDFHRTATEPGLPMLDRVGTNYGILRRWFGALVAEPEFDGADAVNFYVRDDERGRLDDVTCYPASRDDLKGPLKQDFDALASKIKKAKPESSTEQVLHSIIRRTFNSLNATEDQEDHDAFFFKYRQGKGPWHLVWCWGYQRVDLQPAPAVICTNPDCNQLFVHRPGGKARCPGCQVNVVRKRGGSGFLRRAALWLLLLLLAAAVGMLALGDRTALVVTPNEWSGPAGSRVQFHVEQRDWYFFKNDVTRKVVAQSQDRRIIEFDKHGRFAKAKKPGQTEVTFRLGDRVAFAAIDVGPPKPPKSITIEPDALKLAIGSSAPVKVLGHYDEGKPVDVTEIVQWGSSDPDIATVVNGQVHGEATGKVTVTAHYPDSSGSVADDPDGDHASGKVTAAIEATLPVEVAQVKYKSLEINLDPLTLGLEQTGKLEVFGVDEGGKKYSLAGSPELKVEVKPPAAARVQGEDIVGKAAGPAELHATFGELTESSQFMVANSSNPSLPGGTFIVSPKELSLFVDEYVRLTVSAASADPIASASSDPKVVEVIGDTELVGQSPGTADVTVSQGDKKEVVKVTVVDAKFESLRIDPPRLILSPGEIKPFRVVGRTADGKEIDLAARRLKFKKQPLGTIAELNRDRLELTGKSPTGRQPEDLVVTLGDKLQAAAKVDVVDTGLAQIEDDFGAYPPVGGSGVIDLGNGLVFRDGKVIIGDLPADSPLVGYARGTVLNGINGFNLIDRGGDEIVRYFRDHPVVLGDRVEYFGPDGMLVRDSVGKTAVQDVKLLSVQSSAVSPTDFNAAIRIAVREKGEYRLVDAAGNALGDWKTLDANSDATINSAKIPRTPSDRYELFIERKTGDQTEKFQIKFKLDSEQK